MSVVVTLQIPAEEFDLGRITAGPDDVHIRLDRVVPTGDEVMPYFWAEGGEFEAFENRVRSEQIVDELEAVDRVDDQVLYRVTWGAEVYNFTSILVESGATILEATGNSPWEFKLRFPSHTGLRDFHNYCHEQGIEYTITSLSDLELPEADSPRFELSKDEHELLVTAVEQGYFAQPQQITVSELAATVDLPEAEVSARLGRAAQEVLSTVLLPTSSADLKD